MKIIGGNGGGIGCQWRKRMAKLGVSKKPASMKIKAEIFSYQS